MFGDPQRGEETVLVCCDLRPLLDLSRWTHKGSQMHSLEDLTDPRPLLPRAKLDDPHQQQGQPAQQDMGPDALLPPMVNRAYVQCVLERPEGLLHLQKLLVAKKTSRCTSSSASRRKSIARYRW